MEQFRKMRRKRQELSLKEVEGLLLCSSTGVLAVHGDGGYPYAVPINYVYAEGKIFFHSALEGHKMDAIRADKRVSFCVVAEDEVIPAKFTTMYRSVVLFGCARQIEHEAEKRAALRLLIDKYKDETVTEEMMEKAIADGFSHLVMVGITIDHVTGKEGSEFVRRRMINQTGV